MKKILFSVLIVLLFSCKDSEPDLRTECQKSNLGYIVYQNKSVNAFDLFVNGKYYRQIPGNSVSSKISYPAGKSYALKAQQVSGYIIYPTVVNATVTLNQCDEKSIQVLMINKLNLSKISVAILLHNIYK